MKRRKAILQLSAFSLFFAGIGFGSWKFYRLFKDPQISDLDNNGPLLSALIDTIIPRSDTPGAVDAGVADYVAMMVRETLPRKEQNNFIHGISELRSHCQSTYGQSFEACPMSVKMQLLNDLESSTSVGIMGKVENKIMGRSFYTILKSLTIEGYCTSEIGATKHLAYQYIPGVYIACTDLSPNQKSWATK